MAFPGGHGEYMRSKRLKQMAQLETIPLSSIFKGVKLYFNGHTGRLTMIDMKKLVASHGAIIHESYSAKVDYIIATEM